MEDIGTLGPPGTYSHKAALVFDDSIRFYKSVPAVAEGIAKNEVGSGVLPIENSIEGSVNATLDALTENDLYITAEVELNVRHALLSSSSSFIEIVSHPQALAQCRVFLRENYPDVELRSVESTAKGAEEARENPEIAAIARPELADDKLEVIETDIQDTESRTRFVKLEKNPKKNGEKTTIVVRPEEDRPGLLYDILEVFKERNINLTRLESRPSRKELGEYIFHIDFIDGYVDDILEELEDSVKNVDYLGSYDEVGSSSLNQSR